MRGVAEWVVAAGVAMALVGCSGGGTSRPAAEVADSAGVRIVTYDLTDVAVPTYASVGEHDLEIGRLKGAPEYEFSRIIDLRTTDDGSIVVSDGVASELRVYDANGMYVRTLGKRGGGPGEFATAPLIAGMALDTVFAWDGRNRRFTSFSLAGDLVETTTLRTNSVGPLKIVRLDDGTYLLQSRWIGPESGTIGPHDIRVELDSVVIEHIDADGALIDTVRVLADMERARMRRVVDEGRVAMQMMARPLTPRAFLRSDGARPIIGHNGSFEVASYDLDGGAQSVLGVEGAWPTATAGEIRARLEAQLIEVSDGEVDPRTRRVYEEFMPERVPEFSNVLVSGEGDVWVASYEFDLSNGFEWLVFSPAGELRGSVRTPPGLRVFEVRGGSIVGVVRDDFDVPYVRRYPLVRGREGAGE